MPSTQTVEILGFLPFSPAICLPLRHLQTTEAHGDCSQGGQADSSFSLSQSPIWFHLWSWYQIEWFLGDRKLGTSSSSSAASTPWTESSF